MKARRASTAGGILFTVLATMTVLAALVAGAITLTGQFTRNAARSRAMAQALAVGDGAMQMLYADWQVQSRDYAIANPLTPLPSFTPSSTCLPTGAEFPGLQSYFTGANRLMIDPASYNLTPIVLSGTSTKATGTSPSVAIYYYKASVDVTSPALTRPVTTQLRRVFEQQIESAWRYQTFYEFDLEAQPDGSPLAMNGDVHSNGNLYSGTDWLSIAGQASSAKGFINGWAPGDADNASRPTTMPTFSGGQPVVAARKDLLGIDPQSLDATDANLNNDDYRELIERPVTSGSGAGPDPFSGNRLYEQAGIKVLVDAANGLTVMDQSGTVHSSPTDPFFTTIQSAIITGQTIQDGREAANVRLTTLDVSKITDAVNAGTLTFNGIIFISDTSATPAAKRGVRLWRGARLPASGLTVATDNPVYIWGDYNTGGTYATATDNAPTTQPDSNTNGNPANAPSSVIGYTPAPAAVFGDATTILSNAWIDANSTNSLPTRLPTNTTVNAGLTTGSVATNTVTNTFGLGVEGMVRFLENWKPADLGGGGPQARFTYYGSLISLWRAQQASGAYSYGTYYTVPANHWFYDTHFLTNPPKPLLGIMSFSKGRWYLE
jgi:hypothetical protein